jgi:hypothetical protein
MVLTVAAALLLTACVSQSVKKVNTTQAAYADRELPAHELLEVAIATFDPGIPETIKEQESANVVPAVREAEARYLPTVLRQTLAKTGYWGAVRVVPDPQVLADLMVRGTILDSDGERLRLAIVAEDASGRVWLRQTYEETAAELAYTEKLPPGTDPFQDLYNRIANDLLQARQRLPANELVALRRIAALRFAAQLSPERFGEYLSRDARGRYRVQRLPPSGDPLLAKVEQISARDALFVDTLDQHYAAYTEGIDRVYHDWRAASYREALAYRELLGQEWRRKILGAVAVIGGVVAASQADSALQANVGQLAVIGGIYAFKSGMDKGAEKKLHAEALRELGQSLGADVEPRTVELEGRTVMLTGSAEEQYRQWQALLREMYRIETGQPAAADG